MLNPLAPAYLEDPYPQLAALREQHPIWWDRRVRAWFVAGFEECEAVLRDSERFSADPASDGGELGQRVRSSRRHAPLGGAPVMGNSDPPIHGLLRRLVNRHFTPQAVAALRPFAERVAEDLLSAAPNGPWDFMERFAQPFPVLVILRLLGVPREQQIQFRRWCSALAAARAEGPGELVAAADAAARGIMDALRTAPAGTVLGEIRQAGAEAEVPIEWLAMLVVHLATAGNGPFSLFLGNAVRALAAHPDAHAALREGQVPWRTAIDELLRFDPPAHAVTRWARRPVRLAGERIRPGDAVHLLLGAANRDPRRFSEPDRLDLRRPPGRHAAFGLGPHFCLGANLARMEAEAALGALLRRRFEVLEWEPLPSFQLRGPRRLILRWA